MNPSDRRYLRSYWKTLVGAVLITGAGMALALALPAWISGPLGLLGAALGCAVAGAGLLVVAGGAMCLYRDRREHARNPDLIYQLLRRPRRSLLPRAWLGRRLRRGDRVRVRPAEEILKTLDVQGKLDGLPFMPEMVDLCGSVFQVDRRVDKINDMILKTGPRRVTDTLTLERVRCDGAWHDGCQAGCQVLWKEAWLERLDAGARASAERAAAAPSEAAARLRGLSSELAVVRSETTPTYMCQSTQQREFSRPMSPRDPRQDLRPLLSGNIGLAAFCVSRLTAVFNWVQDRRGGIGYPYMPAPDARGRTPRKDAGLRPGELVRIRDKPEIAETLVNSRNRGLWFDRDMVRFCGQSFAVEAHVSRLIDERNGKMLEMKTPCVVLSGVTATGEFLRMCPQNERIYWREIWLARQEPRRDPD